MYSGLLEGYQPWEYLRFAPHPKSLGACCPIEEAGLSQLFFPVGSFAPFPSSQGHVAKSKGIFGFHNLVGKGHYWHLGG